ncbi:hypothetical protein [Marinivivus vitaminiproducens]|uniref:hypothetical protein n=1 Tax=Marinivivus vitaminiproducens TaxID=3035935 RepID=UPI0027A94BB4|nr:hypothetical protein P4R82_24940 [Geminicoccaceae bacterium SCSIO 64248]
MTDPVWPNCPPGLLPGSAARLGRPFIGIEIERRSFDIACQRIDDARKQGDLIRDRLPPPAAQILLLETAPVGGFRA